MAKCHQCPTLAIYSVGEQGIPLCLDCYFKVAQIQQQQLEELERASNYCTDQIWASVGLRPQGARYPPRPKPVYVGNAQLNNISVNNSVVGTINTGSIQSVDQSITALVQTGEQEVAKALKALSEAVLQSQDLSNNQRKELIEILGLVAREAAGPAEARKNFAVAPLLERAQVVTGLAADITQLCQTYWPVLIAFFSVGGS
ncbi:hypothetical protein M0D48_08430 [Xanthomonas prunicola]|uniref:hypothetical protein n=1 Tax=Xanthomonas prunicola TaxID=2053930 RepID=UPI0021B2BE82|nr:hypothetical protein [Xanthomonas prunicola]UXA62957.1 hypothetical protein M0D48_08430 [Xanthomonas prunicola]